MMSNIPMDNIDLLRRAEVLADQGDVEQARVLIRRAIRQDPRDYDAWWAKALLAPTPQERREALHQVLYLRPDHPYAKDLLDETPVMSRRKTVYKRSDSYAGHSKDYLPEAIITFIAYHVFWFLGLGLNIYFLHDARQREQQQGIHAESKGCLHALMSFYVVLPLVFVVLGAAIAIFVAIMEPAAF